MRANSTASMPVGVRPPWVKISQRSASPGAIDLLGVDRDDDALVAELVGGFGDEFRPFHRRGVDRDLVGAGQQQLADIVDLRARRRRRSAA